MDIADKYLHSAVEGEGYFDKGVDNEGNPLFPDGWNNHASFGTIDDKDKRSKASLPATLFFTDLPEDFRHLEIFKDLCKLFANTNTTRQHHDLGHLYYWSYFFKTSGPLMPHVDRRACAFSIPLYGATDPVSWYEDDGKTVLMQYIYDGPTLINTSIKHGCVENTGVRLFFQIGGFAEPFKKIAKAI